MSNLKSITQRFNSGEIAKTDGGSPSNGHECHQYMKWARIHTVVVSLKDPDANGLVENYNSTNSTTHLYYYLIIIITKANLSDECHIL